MNSVGVRRPYCYMNALFGVGYDLAVHGYSWEKKPPHYSPSHCHRERSGGP